VGVARTASNLAAGPVPRWRWSLVWPLALVYGALIVYASLYPFTGWRWQGIAPWSFLLAPWPRYWTVFDTVTNLLGYLPWGLLVTLAVARSGSGRAAFWVALIAPPLLSGTMESFQSFLLVRVPSQVDWWLNSCGGWMGACLAWGVQRWRVWWRWVDWRQRYLLPNSRGAQALLLCWPLAVLYPTAVPFGLGQVWQRLAPGLATWLEGSALQHWWPALSVGVPLSPLAESVVVALSLVAPLWLGYALLRQAAARLVFALVFMLLGWAVGGLSGGLTFGPEHAWSWLTAPVWLGLAGAAVLGVLGLGLGHRLAALLSVLAWGWVLVWLNQSVEPAYLTQSLQIWEQGRFIRFHGLSQWVGWLWPYVAIWVGARLALQPGVAHYNARP